MLANKLLSSLSGSASALYSDDVFQTVVRSGTGATATVTTGFQPDLVWTKARNTTEYHCLFDPLRGVNVRLCTNVTNANETVGNSLTGFTSTGFTLGSSATVNSGSNTYVDFVWKKAPKFFDVVTYTGNGVAGRTISHALGVAPGMVIVKATSTGDSWWVWHRSGTQRNDNGAYLNSAGAYTGLGDAIWGSVAGDAPDMNASSFGLGSNSGNTNGVQYVAYLFAHDASTDGIIQCGSFTTDGSGNATVNLGWEPQYVMLKASAIADGWKVLDSMRGWRTDSGTGLDMNLSPNTSAAETGVNGPVQPTTTGFRSVGGSASRDYIYLAIRRPNKPPTTGTQVYNAIARTGTGAAATVTGVGFAPDLVIPKDRKTGVIAGGASYWSDRLRGTQNYLRSDSTAAEVNDGSNGVLALTNDGANLGADGTGFVNYSGANYINHFFKRAPGVFDEVCYTGTDTTQTINHSLGVAPEMIIVKRRNSAGSDWCVYTLPTTATKSLYLNTTGASANDNLWSPGPTSSAFYLPGDTRVNGLFTYVAYLWATKAGISKVGSYTGNGGTQTINCGFTTGCRFFMCKRTDSTGDWYVWDTARGIIAGNDPHLSLNTTAAEVTTDDSVDPVGVGIDVLQNSATNINISGATYIYLAFS